MKAAQYSETYKGGAEFKHNSECSVKVLAQFRCWIYDLYSEEGKKMHLCQLVKIQAHIFIKINMNTSQEFWSDKMIDGKNNIRNLQSQQEDSTAKGTCHQIWRP